MTALNVVLVFCIALALGGGGAFAGAQAQEQTFRVFSSVGEPLNVAHASLERYPENATVNVLLGNAQGVAGPPCVEGEPVSIMLTSVTAARPKGGHCALVDSRLVSEHDALLASFASADMEALQASRVAQAELIKTGTVSMLIEERNATMHDRRASVYAMLKESELGILNTTIAGGVLEASDMVVMESESGFHTSLSCEIPTNVKESFVLAFVTEVFDFKYAKLNSGGNDVFKIIQEEDGMGLLSLFVEIMVAPPDTAIHSYRVLDASPKLAPRGEDVPLLLTGYGFGEGIECTSYVGESEITSPADILNGTHALCHLPLEPSNATATHTILHSNGKCPQGVETYRYDLPTIVTFGPRAVSRYGVSSIEVEMQNLVADERFDSLFGAQCQLKPASDPELFAIPLEAALSVDEARILCTNRGGLIPTGDYVVGVALTRDQFVYTDGTVRFAGPYVSLKKAYYDIVGSHATEVRILVEIEGSRNPNATVYARLDLHKGGGGAEAEDATSNPDLLVYSTDVQWTGDDPSVKEVVVTLDHEEQQGGWLDEVPLTAYIAGVVGADLGRRNGIQVESSPRAMKFSVPKNATFSLYKQKTYACVPVVLEYNYPLGNDSVVKYELTPKHPEHQKHFLVPSGFVEIAHEGEDLATRVTGDDAVSGCNSSVTISDKELSFFIEVRFVWEDMAPKDHVSLDLEVAYESQAHNASSSFTDVVQMWGVTEESCPPGFTTEHSDDAQIYNWDAMDLAISGLFPSCALCAKGFYSHDVNSSRCDPCMAGSFSEKSMATECMECSPGYFSTSTGQSLCTPCLRGSYMPSFGAQACLLCAVNQTTMEDGSKNCSVIVDENLEDVVGIVVEFLVTLNDAVIANAAMQSGITNITNEEAVVQLLKDDTASAFTSSVNNVKASDVTVTIPNLRSGAFTAQVRVVLVLDVPEKSSDEMIHSAMEELDDLSADKGVQLLSENPDKFFGRTVLALNASTTVDGIVKRPQGVSPRDSRMVLGVQWIAMICVFCIMGCSCLPRLRKRIKRFRLFTQLTLKFHRGRGRKPEKVEMQAIARPYDHPPQNFV